MTFRSSLPAAAVLALGLLNISGPASAGDYRVGDVERADGRVSVYHRHQCGSCGLVRQYRAGEWDYVVPRAPRADYGQALPIYQPPIYAHPGEVVPVYPLYPRSGAYPVMGAPGRPPMMAPRPYYPTGADARVITLNDPPAAPRPNRRRR